MNFFAVCFNFLFFLSLCRISPNATFIMCLMCLLRWCLTMLLCWLAAALQVTEGKVHAAAAQHGLYKESNSWDGSAIAKRKWDSDPEMLDLRRDMFPSVDD